MRAFGVLLMLLVFIRLKIFKSWGGVHGPCGSEWGGILCRCSVRVVVVYYNRV